MFSNKPKPGGTIRTVLFVFALWFISDLGHQRAYNNLRRLAETEGVPALLKELHVDGKFLRLVGRY